MFKQIKKVVIACVFSAVSFAAVAAIDVYDFDSEEKEKEFKELTLQLRCPKCQNNSIGDSNAVIATDMRAKVYELMQEGYTKQQVIDYMIERYGNFVTYQPPLNAATIILWAGPLLFLVIGGVFIVKMSRRKLSAVSDADALAEDESQRLARLLNENNTSNKGGKKS